MPVRVTTWNCCQGTDLRVPVMLDRLAPDIAVVPESSAAPALAGDSLMGPGVPHLWTGTHQHKGLGILAPSAERLERVQVDDGMGQLSLGARVETADEAFGVLGVWTVPMGGSTRKSPYLGALDDILRRHEDMLAAGDVIVAGDFNASGQSDPDTFPAFLEEVATRYGIVSAYHAHTGDDVGAEIHPTLWWRHQQSHPFHCDLVLVPASWTLTDVVVGTFDDWCAPTAAARSDHAPVTVDVRTT